MLHGQVQSLVAKRVGIRVRRRRVSHTGGSGEHRALGCQKRGNCTLGQLMGPRFESAFFASFLCRFGQRNDVPPRTVANSAKENSQLKQTTNPESSNPAMTPTANARIWHPSTDPDHKPENPPPRTPPPTTNPKKHPPKSANARRSIGPKYDGRQRR